MLSCLGKHSVLTTTKCCPGEAQDILDILGIVIPVVCVLTM